MKYYRLQTIVYPLRIFSFLLLSFHSLPLKASGNFSLPDSIPHTIVKLRLSSAGLSYFSGQLRNYNANLDITAVYEKNSWGGLFSKTFDFNNWNSTLNFIFITAFKRFNFGNRFTFTPSICYGISQAGQFYDSTSDAAFSLALSFKPSKKIQLANTVLAVKLLKDNLTKDLINRLYFEYQHRFLSIAFFLWYNLPVFDGRWYVSAYPYLVFEKFKVSNHLSLQAIIGYYQPLGANQPGIDKHGLNFSLLFTY